MKILDITPNLLQEEIKTIFLPIPNPGFYQQAGCSAEQACLPEPAVNRLPETAINGLQNIFFAAKMDLIQGVELI
jgi:hypothetical protein